jgi:hypothetical protein
MDELSCIIIDDNPFTLYGLSEKLLTMGITTFPFRDCLCIQSLLPTISADLIIFKSLDPKHRFVDTVSSLREQHPNILLLAISDPHIEGYSVLFDGFLDSSSSIADIRETLSKHFSNRCASLPIISDYRAFPLSSLSLSTFFRSARAVLGLSRNCIVEQSSDLFRILAVAQIDLTQDNFTRNVNKHFSQSLDLFDAGGIIDVIHLELLDFISWELDKLELTCLSNDFRI